MIFLLILLKRNKRMLKSTLFSLVLLLLFLSCERDDICDLGTPGTPRLIVRLYDAENPTQFKSVQGYIQEINKDELHSNLAGDSIAFPMKLSMNSTRYTFVIENSAVGTGTINDTLQFNYHSRTDRYTRRACGIVSEYVLDQNPVTPINTPRWFVRAEILIDTLRNEEQAHLAIYH
jgi:hypothetical protein